MNDSRFIIGVASIQILLAGIAFLKDVLIASYFGTSPVADAFTLAFFIPDTIGNNWFAAAVGVASVPIFASLHSDNQNNLKFSRNFQLYFTKVMSHVTLLSLIICLLLYIFSSLIISILGEGFDSSVHTLGLQLLWILIPIGLFLSLFTVGSAALQASNSFMVPALAPVLFNIVFLLCTIWAILSGINKVTGAYLISFGILVGVLSMVLYVFHELFHKGMRFQKSKSFFNVYQWQISPFYSLLLPYLFILFSTQLIYFVERLFAARLGEGTISGLTYAFRLAQFPNWVFVGAISVVILPAFTRACNSNEYFLFRNLFVKATGMSLLVTMPCALILSFATEPIIKVLFMRGAFDAESVVITSSILKGYAWAIVGQSVSVIGLRYWLAVGRLGFPVMAGLISAVITVLFNMHFIETLGALAIGWGAAMGSVSNAILLCSAIVIDLRIRKKLWAGKEDDN